MTTPQPIDLGSWPRAEAFDHYRHRVPCGYSVTVELDVTELTSRLRSRGRKTYPAQLWALATVVNRHEEFRLTLDDEGRPAVWPVVHPAFTVLNPERETFAAVCAPYDADFGRFHDQAAELLARHRDATEMFPEGGLPPDAFDVSSLPWRTFTSFSLHFEIGDHFLPIFTLGRAHERNGRVLLPLAVQVHHAAADGFHTARLLDELESLMAEPDWV